MKLFSLALILLCLASIDAFGQTRSDKTLFVFDASGSMWAKLAGEEKIVTAKRVLKDAIGKLPDTAEVGLIAYGHRSRTDCNDIETLTTVRPIERAGLSRQIDALDPKGKTPITAALQKAVDDVKALRTKDPVKVVLISDGLETCAGDPCKLIRDAKAAGVNISVHVIGFDVGGVNYSQLECIAQAGGGSYTNAQNSQELAGALSEAVSAEAAVYSSRLSIKAMANGKLTDASVVVVRAGTTDAVEGGRTYDAAETNPRVLPVPAGKYDVKVTAVDLAGGPVREFKNIALRDGETVERVADFSVGGLNVAVTRNGRHSDASVQVFTAGTRTTVASGRTYTSGPISLRVNAGKYDITIASAEIAGAESVVYKNIVIGADGGAHLKHEFSSGALSIGAKRAAELVDATITISEPKTGRSIAGKRTYTSPSSNPAVFDLEPGTYRVQITAVRPAGLRPQTMTVTITATETLEKTVIF